MPGVHAPGVGPHPPGLAPLGGHDVQLAVGLQEHEAVGLGKDDPAAVGRVAGEEAAPPVAAGAAQGLGLAAAATVEGDAEDLEAKPPPALEEFLALLAGQQDAVAGQVEVVGHGPGEEDLLAVGAPDGVGLDVAGVVRAGEGGKRPGLAVVDGEDALDGEEELGEVEAGLGDEDGAVLDGGDDEAAVGGDLGQEAEGGGAVLPAVVGPGDDVVLRQLHLRGDLDERVGPLVVGVVDVHAEEPTVGGEGVAVAADGQPFEHDGGRRGRGDAAEAPADAGGVADGVDEGEVDLAVEDRAVDGVRGRAERGRAGGADGPGRPPVDAGDGEGHDVPDRAPLHLVPGSLGGGPLAEVGQVVRVGSGGEPEADEPGVGAGVVPGQARRRQPRRVDGAVLGGEQGEPGGRGCGVEGGSDDLLERGGPAGGDDGGEEEGGERATHGHAA